MYKSERNQIELPQGSLPHNPLSTWEELRPDVKLPDIRDKAQGEIYYTRGKIGQRLNRPKPNFDVSDPLNRRTVMDTKEYSALHDPHCKGYFKQKSVKKHLKNQKLINNNGEVLCNVNEFNHYRSYLGSLFSDQVKRRISDSDSIKQMETDLGRSICLHDRKMRGQQVTSKSAHIVSKHKLMNFMYTTARQREYESKIDKWKQKLNNIDKGRIQKQIARTGEYSMKHMNAYLTRQKADRKAEFRKKNTLTRIAYSETKNEYVTKYDKFVKLALFERYKADQAAIMIARDDQIEDMETLVAETLKRGKALWVDNYNKYIEHNRDNPRSHYEYAMHEGKQRHYLMRKYFDRWRKKTLKHRIKLDGEHQTAFEVDKKFRPYVVGLKTRLPYEEESSEEPLQRRCTERTINALENKRKSGASIRSYQINEALSKSCTRIPSISQQPKKKSTASSRRSRHRNHFSFEDAEFDEAELIKAGDKYIDQFISDYELRSDLLKTKLKRETTTSEIRHSLAGSSIHRGTADTITSLLDEEQEGQKEVIELLHDINDVAKVQPTAKGWKGLK